MTRAYYNEFDPKAAAWLRELIKARLIMDGDVDERSIADVKPCDLRGYTRVHFFAGIGGWDYALQLAGWRADRPVWTGSCPCQPFSAAGKQQGTKDARHLWPEMFRLICECRPDCILGEQVASAIGHGWLDGVCADLDAEGYACGAIVLGAHSVGAPHIRQRLWWGGHRMADIGHERARRATGCDEEQGGRAFGEPSGRGGHLRLADAASGGFGIDGGAPRDARHHDQRGDAGGMGNADSAGRETRNAIAFGNGTRSECPAQPSALGGLGHPIHQGPQGHGRLVNEHDAQGWDAAQRHGAPSGFWSDFDLIPCADGKARRIEPGLAPLAHGIPARVVRLRGYGNAIVPQVAAKFIRAFAESIEADP